jgi:hypothetical protein
MSSVGFIRQQRHPERPEQSEGIAKDEPRINLDSREQ